MSPWEFKGGHPGNWGEHGGQDSPVQVGQQPPDGAGSGWEQGTEQLTVSQRTRPPCQDMGGGSSQVLMVPWEGVGGRDAHLAGAALASWLCPVSTGLPRDPSMPTMAGWRDGGASGSHDTWGWLREHGWGGGRELGARSCHREVGRGGAPWEQVGARREQDKGGWMLQGLQDGRRGQDRFGVP